MSGTTRLFIACSIIIVIALAFWGGFMVRAELAPKYPEGLDEVAEVWNLIQENFVDREAASPENLKQAAIQGLVDYLNDPYTSYMSPEIYRMFSDRLSGDFTGIGAWVTVDDGRLVITSPMPGSPAEAAGIRPMDEILRIDGEPVDGMSFAEVIMKVRGIEGTPVTLTVLQEGESQPVDITIIRAKINVPSVMLEIRDGVACITITNFDEGTDEELFDIIREVHGNAAEGIVLDLRGNSGGLLTTVLRATSVFVTDGVILEVTDGERIIRSYRSERVDVTTDLPMVVLVNGNSASGSEAMAGALQAQGRAHIAGMTTFGKGSMNVLYPLEDGSGLYLTIARWITPDGRMIEGTGIVPDTFIDTSGDSAITWAIDYLKGNN